MNSSDITSELSIPSYLHLRTYNKEPSPRRLELAIYAKKLQISPSRRVGHLSPEQERETMDAFFAEDMVIFNENSDPINIEIIGMSVYVNIYKYFSFISKILYEK